MTIENTNERYGAIAASLHWIIGILIIGLLCVGLYMTSLQPSAQMFKLYALHKSFGITVLSLAVLRLLWRVRSLHPAPLPSHQAWEKTLAGFIHFMLYVFMFVMPLSGWLMSSAKGYTVSVFGWFSLPDLISPDKARADLLVLIHKFSGYGLIAAFVLHAAGALKHAIIDRDSTLARMVPFLRMAVVLFALFSSAAVRAQEADVTQWKIDREHSKIAFAGKQMGAPFTGTFKDFDGTIAFDPARLEDSRIEIHIKTVSVFTNSPDRDKAILGKEWFDVESFPESVYVADKFSRIDPTHFSAHGSLKIRDITVPVDLPFSLDITDDGKGHKTAVVKGDADLNRLDFKLGGDQWKDEGAVSGPVKVNIDITAQADATP